jgi:hypothetical protein
MPQGTLRLPRSFLAVGFVCVIVGTVAWVIASPYVTPNINSVATSVGFAFVGLTWWRWTNTATSEASLRWPSRLLAVASLCWAVAYGAVAFNDFKTYSGNPMIHWPHERLQEGGGTAIAVGLCLAALGFWIASNVRSGNTASAESLPKVDINT